VRLFYILRVRVWLLSILYYAQCVILTFIETMIMQILLYYFVIYLVFVEIFLALIAILKKVS